MDDKEIKCKLADACLLIRDAAKAWPRYPEQAIIRLAAALEIIDEVKPFVIGGNNG